MRFDLQNLFTSDRFPSREAWYFPIQSPDGQWVGVPTAENRLTVFSTGQERVPGCDFSIPPDTESLALHPNGKLLACLSPDRLLLIDGAGKVSSSRPFRSWQAPSQFVSFHPSGNSLGLITPTDDHRDSYTLTHLATPSFDLLKELELEGDPEGYPLATWLMPDAILQVEINAGPNGFITNFVHMDPELTAPAFPPYDGGEACFARLLKEDRVLQVSGAKAFVMDRDRSQLHAELYFKSGYRAGLRPGFWRGMVFIPLQNVDPPHDSNLTVLDTRLSPKAEIPLPDLGEYVSFWCEGPIVLAECRESGKSTFHGWRII
jgi:hypothetical protein